MDAEQDNPQLGGIMTVLKFMIPPSWWFEEVETVQYHGNDIDHFFLSKVGLALL